MQFVRPQISVLASTMLEHEDLKHVAVNYNAERWFQKNVIDKRWDTVDGISDEELLVEIMARSCYKSFGVGLNPNITKVRDGNEEYLENVIKSGHGSVLEHATISFMFQDVSRVFTHELVRHRVGTAISQESLRYVRLTELKCFDFPRLVDELTDEEERWFREVTRDVFEYLEGVQAKTSHRFHLNDEKSFARKKKLTSRMRRLAPLGLLTNIGWTANMRTLRHVIPLRTHPSAEEEMRIVFGDVGRICKDRYPNIFFDMEWVCEDESDPLNGSWVMDRKIILDVDSLVRIKEDDEVSSLYLVLVGNVAVFSSTDKDKVESVHNAIKNNISMRMK